MAGGPDGMDEMSDNRNDVTDAAARCARYATHHRSIRWWTLLDIGCLMILAQGARGPGFNSRTCPFSREPSPASLAQVLPASCSHEENRRWARGSPEAAEAARRQPADSQATAGGCSQKAAQRGSGLQQGSSEEAARRQPGSQQQALWQPAKAAEAARRH